ncbi:MAG: class I lanthipeptide [Phycisphaerae bacterium]|nr:class I lanthipeptide [Phycisphaerae bacterium]
MKTAKKLVLNKETVRALQESELLRVAGGANPNGLAAAGYGNPAGIEHRPTIITGPDCRFVTGGCIVTGDVTCSCPLINPIQGQPNW